MEKDMQENIKLEESEKIKKIAKQVLKEIGIKIHILGFKYWVTALLLVIEDEENSENGNIVMMKLYSRIARKHKTTFSKVERVMRYVHLELDLKQQFDVDYPINNTALLFLLKEEVMNRVHNTPMNKLFVQQEILSNRTTLRKEWGMCEQKMPNRP